jgi:ketosteroid isomerase-like protein
MGCMTAPLLEQLREAIAGRDLQSFGGLLADDVRWGDDDNPRRCRSRADVLATFGRLLDEGVGAEITELTEGRYGVLCGLEVEWAAGTDRPGGRRLFHTYLVRDGKIAEIRRYDDRPSAAEAVGIAP